MQSIGYSNILKLFLHYVRLTYLFCMLIYLSSPIPNFEEAAKKIGDGGDPTSGLSGY